METRQGRLRHIQRQTKLQTACQKASGPVKQQISGIKSGCSPIESCATSYEINSNLFHIGFGTCPDTDSEEARLAGWRFYGGINLQTTVRKPDGQQTSTKFNPRGMALEVIDELGQNTQYAFDANQRLIKTTDPLGRQSKYEYDNLGNRTAMVNPLGQRVETTYEPINNNPSQTTRFLLGVPSTQGGQNLSYTPVFSSAAYDSKGNLILALDPAGVQTSISYTPQGQVSASTLPRLAGIGNASTIPVISAGIASNTNASARQIRLTYNAAGDLASITDPLGNETKLATDNLGRSTGATDPLGYSSQTSYNSIDQPTQATNALNQTSRLSYDAAGRITAVINPAGVTIEAYTYDNQGRLTSTQDALNQTTSTQYDASQRPIRVTDRKGQVTSITYNERSQVASITKPDRTISFQYDTLGRTTEIRDAASVVTTQYDAADRITQTDTTTSAGSHKLQYSYDSLDRITSRTLSGTGINGSGINTPEVTNYTWNVNEGQTPIESD